MAGIMNNWNPTISLSILDKLYITDKPNKLYQWFYSVELLMSLVYFLGFLITLCWSSWPNLRAHFFIDPFRACISTEVLHFRIFSASGNANPCWNIDFRPLHAKWVMMKLGLIIIACGKFLTLIKLKVEENDWQLWYFRFGWMWHGTSLL